MRVAKLVVTADGGWRRGNEVKLKAAVDEALKQTPSVEACIVVATHRSSPFTWNPDAIIGGTS
jgi:acyl-coenzyme A synthetase/AMP-(fatty) acid ligase